MIPQSSSKHKYAIVFDLVKVGGHYWVLPCMRYGVNCLKEPSVFSRGSNGRGAAPAVSSQLGRTERKKNFYTPKEQQQTQSKGESTGMFLCVPPLLASSSRGVTLGLVFAQSKLGIENCCYHSDKHCAKMCASSTLQTLKQNRLWSP